MAATHESDDLDSARDYLSHAGLAHDGDIAAADRLDAVRLFHEYLAADQGLEDLIDEEALSLRYRAHLDRAYHDVITMRRHGGMARRDWDMMADAD